MKLKITSAIFPACIFLLTTFNPLPTKEYIRLHYNGDNSKPYPIIIFYMPGFRDIEGDGVFTKKFEISEATFISIKSTTLRENAVFKDTLLKKSFQFSFYYSGETIIFQTTYLSKLRKCFELIVEGFNGNANTQQMLQASFATIISKLKWNEQFDLTNDATSN